MSIKSKIKRILPPKMFAAIRDVFYPEKINILEQRLNSLFIDHYRDLALPAMNQKIAFKNAEFKIFSKHGGDGIIAYIFSKIGVTNRIFIEMGVEDGTECNTANLSFNFGWNGLLIDAEEKWIQSAKNLYKKQLDSFAEKIKMVTSFITAENINQTIQDAGISGEIDLLSIDIDSNDYWIWDKIDVVNPRVVVMEYNAAFGLNSVTITYDPKFHYQETFRKHPLYFGASLSALAKLANKKGYILVTCDTHGHDAFFVRKDVAQGKFIDIEPEHIFYPNPYTLSKYGSVEEQFKAMKHLPYETI